MREIKFRIWDRTNRKMYFANWSDFLMGGAMNVFPHDTPVDIELMQFTGLHDKNGKGREIYEGDIMRSWDNSRSRDDRNPDPYRYFTVKWNTELAQWDGCWLDEITGNRFENPELLK